MNIEKFSVFLKRIRFVRLALVVIAVNILALVLIVVPKRASIDNLQSVYSDLRKQAMADQKEVATLKNRLVKLQQAQVDLKAMFSDVLIPQKQGVTEIRVELEGLARDLQIKHGDYAYHYSDMQAFKVQEFTLSVPVEGNYRNIRKFINSIERSEHFLILDRVDLSSEKRAADLLNLDFQLSTYMVYDEK